MAIEIFGFRIETREDKILRVLDRNNYKIVQDINRELGENYTKQQIAFSLAGSIVKKKVEYKNLGTLDNPKYGWRLLAPQGRIEFEKPELEEGSYTIPIK
jgi:hypothetical protein